MLANNKQLSRLAALIVGVFGMTALSCLADSVKVFPEAWQTLEPGAPPERNLRIELVEKGGRGSKVEIGDLVQLHLKSFWGEPEKTWRDRGEWWIWIGFRGKKETPFYSYLPNIAKSLVGMEEGSLLRILDAEPGWISAGKLKVNPLGDFEYYDWRMHQTKFSEIYVPTDAGYSQLEIKRVCKGKAQYRTLRLYDDSLIQRCSWAPISCEMTKEPREAWMDEAKIEAVCSDGKLAVFQYGPVPSSNGKEWRGPVNPENYFNAWEKEAWKKLPVGVQLK